MRGRGGGSRVRFVDGGRRPRGWCVGPRSGGGWFPGGGGWRESGGGWFRGKGGWCGGGAGGVRSHAVRWWVGGGLQMFACMGG